MGVGTSFTPIEHTASLVPKLREVAEMFRAAGIEPAIWLGHAIGHTPLFSGDADVFAPIRDINYNGDLQYEQGVYCPLGKEFLEHISKSCALLASSGIGMLMFDDDFRLSNHGQNYGCFCPLHMESFRQRTGLDITAEELAKQVRTDLKLRKLWLENNAASLLGMAQAIEKAVHAVNPEMRIGLCQSPQLTGAEGLDIDEICKAFAGDKRPFIRVCGAPYWGRPSENAGEMIELCRLHKSWVKNPETEVFTEGDTFPHNTYVCSANMLEAYTDGLASSGVKGILSYQYSYGDHRTSDFSYENILVKNLDFRRALCRLSPWQWQEVGFEPAYQAHAFRHFPGIQGYWDWFRPPFEFLKFAPRMAVPTAYGNPDTPMVIFGHEAEACSDEQLRDALRRGAAVDAVAAEILMRRGFDLGIEKMEHRRKPYNADITDSGVEYLLRCFCYDVFWTCSYRQDALVRLCSTFDNGDAGIAHLKNADGNKIVFFPWDINGGGWTNVNPIRQKQWQEAYQFLAGEELPLTVNGKADIRLHLRCSPDGNTVAATIQNLSLDVMTMDAVQVGSQWQLAGWMPQGTSEAAPVTTDELAKCELPQMHTALITLVRK